MLSLVEINIKQEPNCIIDEDQHDDPDFNLSNSDSESQSGVVLAKRAAKPRKKRKVVQRVKTEPSRQYNCHKCLKEGVASGEVFASWSLMLSHFKDAHDLDGYMYCCSRKYTTPITYSRHVQAKHDEMEKKQRHCGECNQMFSNEKNYARHVALVHTREEDKQFKCTRCPKAFVNEVLLSSHIKWHDEIEALNHHCAICGIYFPGPGNLIQHNIAHHGTEASGFEGETTKLAPELPEDNPPSIPEQEELIRKFCGMNCTDCDYIGKSFADLARHEMGEHQIKTCAVVCCEKRFNKRYRLYEHCLKHIDPDHFKCKICGKICQDSRGLQQHHWTMHTAAADRPFKCDICDESFMKGYRLKIHMDRHLDKEQGNHVCEPCNKSYTSASQLKLHQHRIHGAPGNWVCDVCARSFSFRSHLENHRKTHTSEGRASLKVQCEFCFKWIKNSKTYTTHKRTCGDTSGPSQCQLCSHVSVSQTALKKHVQLIHINTKKYACSYCGKEFRKQLRLKEHEANHEGVVLYKCPFCPRECNSSSNMYTHKKAAHPEEWAEMIASKHND